MRAHERLDLGQTSSPNETAECLYACHGRSDAEVELTNYTKNGNMFKHKLKGQRLQCAKTGNAVYFVSSTGTPLDGATLVKEPWRDEMSDINNKDFLRSAYG